MQFTPALEKGRLIKRYKRFLADVALENGETITLHCANTGAMTGCAEPGFALYYSHSDNPKRKYPCSWEISVNEQGHRIGVNTHLANKLVAEGIERGVVEELAGYTKRFTEVKYGSENSRIDLLLQNNADEQCYVEVKSVTLLQDGCGYFPDAVSTRGQKHLRELIKIASSGKRAVLFFCVQHSGIAKVCPARHIDPAYADLMKQACAVGVEILAYGCDLSPEAIELKHRIDFSLT